MLLTAAAFVLWALSLLQLSRTGLTLDSMGIIHGLPPTFWAAMGLLTIASALVWVLPREHRALAALQVCLLIFMFWLTPLLLGFTLSGTRYSFGYHTLTQYILRYGRLDPGSQWYHNWPAFNLLDAVIVELSGLKDTDTMLVWAAAPMQFLTLLLLYGFFKYALGPGNVWAAAVWFYVLFNWTAQTYYSPQGLANIILLTLLFLLAMGLVERGAGLRLKVLGMLVTVGLTIAHLLTSVAAAFAMGAVELTKRRRYLPTSLIFSAILIAAWLMYRATAYLDSQVPLFVERALRFDQMWFWNVARAQRMGSAGHLAVVAIRIWYTVAAGAIGLGGLALSRRFRHPADGRVLAMTVGVVFILPFQVYQNELFSRLLLYIMPVLAYFAVRLLRTRTTALLLVSLLLVALPFGVIALHGNQMIDNVSPGQRAYWRFLEHKTTRGSLGLGGIPMTWTFGHPDRYVSGFDWIAFYGSRWQERLQTRGWVEWGMPNYLGFTAYENAGFLLWADYPGATSELIAQANQIIEYNLIYNNGEAVGYYDSGVKFP
jgi:hypothetical protein